MEGTLLFVIAFVSVFITVLLCIIVNCAYKQEQRQTLNSVQDQNRAFDWNGIAAVFYTQQDDGFVASQLSFQLSPSSPQSSPVLHQTPSRPERVHDPQTCACRLANGQLQPLAMLPKQTIQKPYFDNDSICVICLDDLVINPSIASNNNNNNSTTITNTLAALPCRHIMHEHCLRKWITKDPQRSCPICRIPSLPQTQVTQSASTPVHDQRQ